MQTEITEILTREGPMTTGMVLIALQRPAADLLIVLEALKTVAVQGPDAKWRLSPSFGVIGLGVLGGAE